MGRTLTPLDACSIVNLLAKQMTGQAEITATNTSSFVSVGEKILSYGTENVLNQLALLMGKIIIDSEPYEGKYKLITETDTGEYTSRTMEISFYAKEPLNAGGYNTNLYTNLADGFTNGQNLDADGDPQSVKSMWQQNAPESVTFNFGGTSVWDDCITIYENQLQQAFRSAEEFNRFVQGYIIEKGNDMTTQKEAFSRLTFLNYMAGLYDINAELSNDMAIDLTALFNTTFSTNYTAEELKTTYLKEFLAFFTATVKDIMSLFEVRSTNYHWSVPKEIGSGSGVYHHILRHTNASRLRGVFSSKFFNSAKANVLPEIFNKDMLNDGSTYELVPFWQSESSPLEINITPTIPDVDGSGSGAQITGDAVNIDNVLGVIFDERAVKVNYQLDYARTSPIEARKGYYNTWYGMRRNAYNNFTHKGVLLYLG